MSNEILDKIISFEDIILINSSDPQEEIDKIIVSNPRLLFYIDDIKYVKSINMTFGIDYKVRVTYKNKDLDYKDIYILSTENEMLSLISRYIGNYKSKLAVVFDFDFDIDQAFERFKIKSWTMYPNFSSASISSFSVCNKFCYIIDFEYRIGKVKLNMMENEVKSEVNRISHLLFSDDYPQELKVYLAHNYLATTITYYGAGEISILERSYVQSAYGALITKKCVCQGISEAFKRLMDAAKVVCDVVCGSIKGYDDYHAWNIVKFDSGDCYHIDVTWDIDKHRPSFSYFGKTDAFFEKTRSWNRIYNYKCDSKNNLYLLSKKSLSLNKEKLLQKNIEKNILGL